MLVNNGNCESFLLSGGQSAIAFKPNCTTGNIAPSILIYGPTGSVVITSIESLTELRNAINYVLGLSQDTCSELSK